LYWLRDGQRVRQTYDLLILVIALLALHGIWQYFWTDYGDLHRRIPGLFSHYLTFSGVLLVGDLLLIARMVSGGAWRRPWCWLALAAINYTLLLTLSRSAWVALVISLTLYGIVRGRRYLLAYAAGLLLLVFLAPDSWSDRMRSIYDLRDSSNYDRLCMIDAGLRMIAEQPRFGLGPEMVKSRYPIYRHPSAPRFWVPHLHNTFLHLAAERGLSSLAAYLWLMLACLYMAVRGYRREGSAGGPHADLYLGVILVLVGFNIAGLFEANWRDTEMQRLVLFLMAVPICLSRSSDSESAAGEQA
jgi:O-antigen ligase